MADSYSPATGTWRLVIAGMPIYQLTLDPMNARLQWLDAAGGTFVKTTEEANDTLIAWRAVAERWPDKYAVEEVR